MYKRITFLFGYSAHETFVFKVSKNRIEMTQLEIVPKKN